MTAPIDRCEFVSRQDARRIRLFDYRGPVARVVAAWLLLAAALPPAYAANPADASLPSNLTQLSLEQLGSVQVTTVSKEPEEIWNTPAAIYVLTQDDIRRSGATSIPEVLRLVPGVEVARIDSDHWSIGVRGFGSQFSTSLLVLIDGRSVYTPLFAGVYWDVQDTVMEDIDRIEVIRGPGGTIWGSNAVDGVINIITKNSKDTHGTLLSAGGGNLDQGIGEIRQGGALGSSWNYRVYGKAFARGAESHPDTYGNYDDWRQQRASFRMDGDKGTLGSFTLQGDIYNGSDGDITSIGSFVPVGQFVLAGNDQISGGNILGRWKRQFGGSDDMQVQFYYDRTDRRAPHYEEDRDTFDVDFLNHFKLGSRNDFLFGVGARVSPSKFDQEVAALNFNSINPTDSIYSGFVQDTVQIVQHKLAFTAGTKLEHNNLTGLELEPSARLLWTPRAKQTFWASITHAVRTPSRLNTDLQLTDFVGFLPPLKPPIYLQVAGNPDFDPEQMVGTEAGYRQLLSPHFYVDFAAFHDDYYDLSSFATLPATVKTAPITYVVLTRTYSNQIEGTTDGFEIAPDWKVTDWLQLKGSYSYLHMDLKYDPGATDTTTLATDSGSSPHGQIVVQSLLNLPKRFETDLTYRYVSALPAQSVQAYSTGDVRFSWHSPGDVEFSVTGQNLFQPNHGEFGNTPPPAVGIERAVYAKITWTREPH